MNQIPPDFLVYLFLAPALLLADAVVLALIFFRKPIPAAGKTLAFFLIVSAAYLFCNCLELISNTEKGTLFWARLMYLFFVFVPFLCLQFSLKLTHPGWKIPVYAYILVLIFPVVLLFIIFTGLGIQTVWTEIRFISRGPLLSLSVKHGPLFWAYTVYCYSIIIFSFILFLRNIILFRKVYKDHALWIFTGYLIPFVFSLMYVFKIIPGVVKDYTPAGYVISGVILFFGIYNKNLWKIMPIARNTIVEYMNEGTLVVNANQVIVDVNPAAMSILDIDETFVGQSLDKIPIIYELMGQSDERKNTSDIYLKKGDETRYYTLDFSLLYSFSTVIGTLIILKDVTETRHLMEKITRLAFTDELTGVSNRRQFMVSAEQLFSLSKRYKYKMALAIFDLDNFKAINDTYGHQAGDAVLQYLADIVMERIRSGDVFGRFGGDEFALVMPETSLEGALFLCESIRSISSTRPFYYSPEHVNLGVTFSIGIAELRENETALTQLFSRADKALYLAKQEGRNRIISG